MRFENSMCNVAYEILKEVNEKVAFNALWGAVCDRLGIAEEERNNLISSFYTQLTLDGRFMFLDENYWDLRINHTFDEFSDDSYDSYSDDEEDVEDLIDDDEDRIQYEDDEDEDDYDDSEDEDEEESY
jgi:DNA-directed RNA polymerase subunit delta